MEQEKYKLKVEELTNRLEQGIKDLFISDNYRNYLDTMSRFHHYSVTNQILIHMQKPDSTLVAGYKAWETKHGRHVKKGEKGISIFCPAPYKKTIEVTRTDPVTMKPLIGSDGRLLKELKEVKVPAYKVGTVFDVSQTDGKPLPEIVHELKAGVDNAGRFIDAIKEISPVPMEVSDIKTAAKGCYDTEAGKIVIKSGMSDSQTIKTAIHELGHAMLHNRNDGIARYVDRNTKEVQAESIAYVVSKHFGIGESSEDGICSDVSSYSFGYIAGWSKDRELKELRDSLTVIRNTSVDIIDRLEERLLIQEHEEEPDRDAEKLIAQTAEKLACQHSRHR